MNKLVTCFLLLLGSAVYGQQVIRILDGVTESPLAGATLEWNGSIFVSDAEGRISLTSEDTGWAKLRFIGYREKELYLSPSVSIIRMQPDYLLLESVSVNAYQSLRPIKEVAGSYGTISIDKVAGSGFSGMVDAVNAIPGVRMEQRSPGSYRVNIRGSTLRSPFGVRNVKIYYNQIPITEPSGNTPLNLIDLEYLSSLSIIRSPASSLYVAGTGGVMFLSDDQNGDEGIGGSINLAAGSFGYSLWHADVQSSSDSHTIKLSAGSTSTDGYRDHTEMDRKNLSLLGEVKINDHQSLSYTLLYNDIFYELPGGLTAEQRDEDPTQARQIAIDRNSTIDQSYIIAGVSHEIEWGTESGNQTSVFYSQSNKENPFITNYEFEDLTGGGLRTRFYHTINTGQTYLRLTAGGEWQWGNFKANNFGNRNGFPDTLRYVDDTRMFTGFEFLQAEVDWNDWHVVAGASLNHLNYSFDRQADVATDSTYAVDRSFENQFSPRIGIVREFSTMAIFFNASWGFSPPTQDEVRTSDGDINIALEAEKAMSLEAGLRVDIKKDVWYGELTVFRINQNNTIVSQVDAMGNSVFLNSGETLHQGVELLLGGEIISRDAGFMRNLRANASLSWNDLTFKDYVRAQGGENVDFSGNKLTGGVPLSYYLEAQMDFSGRFGLMISHQFTDKIPLNDQNTVFSKPYHLVRARVQKDFLLGKGMTGRLFVGVDNLANETYSLGNDLNAFGSRYFNPSPTRNYFAGMTFTF